MALDSRQMRAGGRDFLAPEQIAQHPLFTAREKLALLEELKFDVATAREDNHELGLSPDEIDTAIEAVRLGAEDGDGGSTVIWGES